MAKGKRLKVNERYGLDSFLSRLFFCDFIEIMTTKFFHIVVHIVTTGYEKKYMIQ